MAKRFLIASGVVLLLFLLCGGALAQDMSPVGDSAASGQEFAPDQLLVRFQPWVTAQRADQLMAGQGASRIRHIRGLGVHVLRLPPGLSVERAMEVFSNIPEVEFAEPNYIMRALAPPKTEIEDQWGLNKIQAPEAWNQIPDKNPVLLAVVDTGIDRNHSDLEPNIWQNEGEIPNNGLDDDQNGYVDDTWGWDFRNNDNDPYDDNMHGTACSSVAAALQDGSGVAGVCPWCTLVAVKVMGADGSGYIDTVATGIIYAADNGARVISLSVGGPGSQTLQNAVNYAWNKGALLVAAAGNEGTSTLIYPAAYANAMAIASTNDQDYRSCFSNYGAGYISVAAPGQSILVAVPDQGYGTYSGTSLSTPHVAGLGGLLFSLGVADDNNNGRINDEIRDRIEQTVNDLGPTGTDAYFGSGRINAYRAVMGDTTPTTPPVGLFSDDLTASGYAHARKLARDAEGTLHLVWHGRDGGQYRVLYATSSDDGDTWSDPQVVFDSTAETYHPALAIGGGNVYIAFPSKYNASRYRIFFTSKPLVGGSWPEDPDALMGGDYHAVRPDLYYDPSNGRLHLVASSFDDAPYVYYTSSGDGGQSWSAVRQVYVGQLTRNAAVHANGPNVYITGRTVEFIWIILPRYRVFSIRSSDDGNSWGDLTHLAVHDGLLSGAYGASLAGVGDQLDLAYEHNGYVYFRRSEAGVGWSAATNVGSGAWPSVTQATDGQAWLMWESGGNLSLRHYTGAAWDPAESVGGGNYPNFKLGTTGGLVEWAATYCSGAPFRLIYDSRTVAANNPPVANTGGPYSGTEEAAIVFDGSGSSDPDGDSLTYDWDFGDGSTGTGMSPSHAYEYGGTFVVTLTVSDGKGGVDTDSTTATVVEVNDSPVADPNGPYSGTAGDPISFDGSASFDPDNQDGTTANDQTLSYAWDFGDETTGTRVSPSHVYGAGGVYTVSLVVSDGVDSHSATTTASVNNPPVANDVTASGDEDTTIPWTPSVSDPEGGTLTCFIVSQPSNGSASVNPDCSSGTYTPNQNFNGVDTFTYMANDGTADSNEATVTITVNPMNDDPVADDQLVTTDEDTPVSITLTGSDVETPVADLTFTVLGGPTHGTLLGTAPNLIYTPDDNYNGSDSFTFKVTDSGDPAGCTAAPCSTALDSGVATVTIMVNAVNDAPVADAQLVTTDEDTPVDITLTGSDPDGDPLTYSVVAGPSNGSLSGTGPNLTYTPNPNFSGADSFTFKVNDGTVDSDIATVSITVNPVSMHVGDLDGYGTSVRNKWTATVTIEVHDASHGPVAGATVTGSWSNGATGASECTTDGSGLCQVSRGRIPKGVPSVDFTLSSVTHTTLTYHAGDNHDPDGDSNGFTITIYLEPPTSQPPVASFTYSCAGLICGFDASGSYDPDGTIISYDWDFGDGNDGSGMTASHTYAADGTYTVILTVTDNLGASGTDTQNVAPGAGTGTIFISGFHLSGKAAGPNLSATVVVTIHDTSGNPVSGATVYGTWSGDYSASVSGITGADGTVRFTSAKVREANATFTFTVDNVFKSGYNYDPSRNIQSSGTVDVP